MAGYFPAMAGQARFNAVLQKDGAGDAGAVIGHASPVALDQSGAEELGGGVDDSGSCGGDRRRFLYRRDLEAGGGDARYRCACTADQRHQDDRRSDQREA